MVRIQCDANGQFKVTLPKQIVMAKGWKKGDKLKVELTDKADILLKRAEDEP